MPGIVCRRPFLALGLPKISTVNVQYANVCILLNQNVLLYNIKKCGMSNSYYLQQKPFVVPKTDGKLIEEHFGQVISNESNISIAHMVAPSGWSEPFQNPEFDEYTIMIRILDPINETMC